MASTYAAANDPNKTASARASQLGVLRAAASFAKAAPITPSDTVDLTAYAARLLVTATGNLKILPAKNDDAATITLTAVTVGTVVPVQTRRVFATGTTASVASLDA